MRIYQTKVCPNSDWACTRRSVAAPPLRHSNPRAQQDWYVEAWLQAPTHSKTPGCRVIYNSPSYMIRT